MKRIVCLIITLLCIVYSASAQYWTEKTSSPARFPYRVEAGNSRWMDLPVPPATNLTFGAYQNTGGGQPLGPLYYTNMIIWSTDDPRYGEVGYWPTYQSATIFANGKYYLCGGSGPNINLAGIYGVAGHNGLSISMGFMWPSNSYPNGEGFSQNRQAGFSVYDPVSDTWQSASWQPADLNGYCIENAGDPGVNNYVSRKPILGQGTRIGANQAFAYDWDDDGVEEIFMHGGYPQWDGHCAIFDPNRGTAGEWTTTPAANNFSSGFKAQQDGGAVRIGADVYCIGGTYWGPNEATHLQIYNITNASWTTHEYVYNKQLRRFGIAPVGTKIYLLGGEEVNGDAYSSKVYMLDTTNIAAGLQVAGSIAVAVRDPSVVSWKGVLYLVAGLTVDGPTNLFQIFNPATAATVIHNEPLPVNAFGASCAVSPAGTFYFGGGLRMVDPVSGWLVNSSRLWTGPMPEQDIFVAPTFLDFWQTNDTLHLRLDNVTGLGILCSNIPSQGWITVDQPVVAIPGGTNVDVAVTVNRASLNGPTNGSVRVAWPGGEAIVNVLCDTPRPIGVVTPATAYTLKPETKSFVLANNGSVPLHFTNSTADAFIANLAPMTGTIAPHDNATVTYDVTAAAPRPLQGSTGTVTVAYNAYNGLPITHRVINFPGEFYVSTTGSDANDGLSWATAWRHIAYAVTNVPNGSANGGDIIVHVAAGTYAGESTGPAGTNWIIDLSNKQYLQLKGAGPQQSILTPGSAIWHLTINNDTMPTMPVIKLFNARYVKMTGFTIDGSAPQAIINGEGYPEHCALIGVQGGGGILLSGLYLKGTYEGQVYNTLSNEWTDSWDQWWYHGVCVNGEISIDDVMLQNCLIQGFVRSVYNNNFGYNTLANTNRVVMDHCTLIEQRGPESGVAGVLSRVVSTERGPQFVTRSSIIGNAPVDTWAAPLPPNAANSYGVMGGTGQDASMRVANIAQSNLFWAIVDDHWWNDFVFGSAEGDLPEDMNLTGEAPVFDHVTYLPYSTDIEDGDWGWSVIPEPALGIGILALAGLVRRRR